MTKKVVQLIVTSGLAGSSSLLGSPIVADLFDRGLPGVSPLDYSPILLRIPFGFHLAADTLSSEARRSAASGPSCLCPALPRYDRQGRISLACVTTAASPLHWVVVSHILYLVGIGYGPLIPGRDLFPKRFRPFVASDLTGGLPAGARVAEWGLAPATSARLGKTSNPPAFTASRTIPSALDDRMDKAVDQARAQLSCLTAIECETKGRKSAECRIRTLRATWRELENGQSTSADDAPVRDST
jgi:hypothetical protein